MDLQSIILSEVSQKEKQIKNNFSHIKDIKKYKKRITNAKKELALVFNRKLIIIRQSYWDKWWKEADTSEGHRTGMSHA